jgi:hypothetical protein
LKTLTALKSLDLPEPKSTIFLTCLDMIKMKFALYSTNTVAVDCMITGILLTLNALS